MSLDKAGAEGIRQALRRLMAAAASPSVHVNVRRRDIELLLNSRVVLGDLEASAPQAPDLHPEQR